MKPSLRLFCLCAAPLALSACQGEKKAAEGGTAQGEILPGSASDAMLPLDTLRSRPPLAPIEVESGKPGKAARDTDAAGEADESEEEPGEAPAAAPAATPTANATP